MEPKILHQGQMIIEIGNLMMTNPNNFMIDTQGKLFSKCEQCDAWHLISDMNVAKKDDVNNAN